MAQRRLALGNSGMDGCAAHSGARVNASSEARRRTARPGSDVGGRGSAASTECASASPGHRGQRVGALRWRYISACARAWRDVHRRGAHSHRRRDARVVDRDLLRAGHDRRPLRGRRPVLNPGPHGPVVKMDSTTTTSSSGTQPAKENAHRVHAGSVGRGHSWGRRAVALQAAARRGSERSSRRTPEEAAGGGVRSSRQKPEEAAERHRSIGAEHCGEHRASMSSASICASSESFVAPE